MAASGESTDQPIRAEGAASSDPGEAEEARVRLEALLGFAPALIMAVSRTGIIEFINWVFPQYSKAEVIGSDWLNYIEPERRLSMKAALDSVLATGTSQTFETATAGPDGQDVWFSSQIGPIRRDGTIVGGVIVSQDVTERKRTQAELMAARRLAVLGTVAAGVAHEINTPVQFVGDSIQFLRDATTDLLGLVATLEALTEADQPDLRAEARAAREAADLPYLRENMPAAFHRCIDGLSRVATIVRSLKAFAHPSGKEMAPADLNQAIQSTLTIASHEYKYVADVVTELDDIPLVTCHLSELNQVMLNIVVNAAHAIADVYKNAGSRGTITVRTRREGDEVVIAVADTGGGIPEEIRTRIFDPFFTTKEVGRGTGQGLAIAWTTVTDQHGGKLTFESRMGKGTTFFIRLPIAGRR